MLRIYRNIEKQCVPFAPVRCTSWFPKSAPILKALCRQELPNDTDFYIHDLHFVFFFHLSWKVSKLSNRNVLAPSYYLWQHVKWQKRHLQTRGRRMCKDSIFGAVLGSTQCVQRKTKLSSFYPWTKFFPTSPVKAKWYWPY